MLSSCFAKWLQRQHHPPHVGLHHLGQVLFTASTITSKEARHLHSIRAGQEGWEVDASLYLYKAESPV